MATYENALGRYDFVRDFAGDATGATDNSAKLTSALSTLVTAGGGRLYFPPGTYKFSGALQDTSSANAQVLLPTIANSGSPATGQQITIVMEGCLPPPSSGESSVIPTGPGYTIFKSTLTGGSGTAAFVSGPHATRNNLHLEFRNIIVQLPANPSLIGLNFGWQQDVIVENVMIHCGAVKFADVTQPTNSNAIGLVLPQNNYSANVKCSNVMIWGMYEGLRLGELLTMGDRIGLCSCAIGMRVDFSYHPNIIHSMSLLECPIGIQSISSSTTSLVIHSLDIENANGQYQSWQDAVYHVDDSSNRITGKVSWHAVDAAVGVSHTFTKNGGTGFVATEY